MTTAPATLLELLDDAVRRFGDRPALRMRREDGTLTAWTYRELDRRTRLAAWRLRALGLAPGDRLLTWAPSSPELAAAYFGAMRARLVIVPLDLRMSMEAIEGIVAASGARHLLLGTGRDAPDPRDAQLGDFPTTTVEAITADADAGAPLPADWDAQVREWAEPEPAEIWELVFTSGTTGTPKGVMLGHDNVSASIETFHRIVPRMEHRIVSLLPLSHLLEQAVGLFYALSVGADILYVRSRNPRVIFDALREHRVTSLIVVPQVLDLFWSAIEREVEKRGRTRSFGRLRAVARRLPRWARRRLFGGVHAQLGGHFSLFVSAGAFLPPALQQAWEDLGVTVLQGYGSTETGTGTCTTLEDHEPGTVGRPPAGIDLRIAEDGEVQFRGPTLFHGYWQAPALTKAAWTADGWYRTGDIGHLDAAGRLILSGRAKDIIVLPNGFNVYPEDIENALRIEGVRDSVVLETSPGRIEAILLAPGTHGLPQGGDVPGGGDGAEAADPAAVRARIDAAVKAANARLGPNQRIAGWRLWPDGDFPRTHTLKVRRDRVRAWASVEVPLPVAGGRDGGGEGGARRPSR
ncbi:MAG: AMP-binding protein [Chloroflexi bacterium]|nr:AMP-binding protein [Chloroflexota bacterium]